MVKNCLGEQEYMGSLNRVFLHSPNGYAYPIIKGEPYCCVPTCLKMIFDSMGFFYSVDQIASYFQIITPPEADCDSDIGIHLGTNPFSDILTSLQIPLTEEYISINYIHPDLFEDKLTDLLQEKVHILCGYSYGSLFDNPSLKDIGHVSIVSCTKGNSIGILNPGPANYGLNYVDDYALYQAIRYFHAGLWIFRPTK